VKTDRETSINPDAIQTQEKGNVLALVSEPLLYDARRLMFARVCAKGIGRLTIKLVTIKEIGYVLLVGYLLISI
jgi:hypothetical protein